MPKPICYANRMMIIIYFYKLCKQTNKVQLMLIHVELCMHVLYYNEATHFSFFPIIYSLMLYNSMISILSLFRGNLNSPTFSSGDIHAIYLFVNPLLFKSFFPEILTSTSVKNGITYSFFILKIGLTEILSFSFF